MNSSYVERYPNIAKLAKKSIALEVLHDEPSREELIETIRAALDNKNTPYYLLHTAAAMLRKNKPRETQTETE